MRMDILNKFELKKIPNLSKKNVSYLIRKGLISFLKGFIAENSWKK